MDKMVHTALNSLKMILQNQQITSQNISNASVVGYRRDSNSEFGTAYLNSEEGLNTKVFATREIGAFSTQQGDLESTENPLDVAIKGEGYFIIQPKEGEIALSRRGDFKVDVEGQLVNGEGSLVLGEDLQPIVLPAFNAIQISSDGLINIKPIDAPADAPFQLAATLGTTIAEELELEKDINGFIKPKAKVNENGELISISKDGFSDIKIVENGRLYKDGNILEHDFESNSSERSKLSFSGVLTVSIQVNNNKIQKKSIVNTIGIPEFDEKGIRLVDLVQERLSQIIKSSKVDEKLENRIKNAVTKEINYIWGKKPFVEVIIHYN